MLKSTFYWGHFCFVGTCNILIIWRFLQAYSREHFLRYKPITKAREKYYIIVKCVIRAFIGTGG